MSFSLLCRGGPGRRGRLSENSSSGEATGMQLRPVELMWARVKRAHEDSDTALLYDLLYAGEFVIRLTTAAVLAAIEEDRDRHRYRLLHTLVRADGIGEWSRALDDALVGPASHHLLSAAKDDSRIFTERLGAGSWQFEAVTRLFEVQREIDPELLKARQAKCRCALGSQLLLRSEIRRVGMVLRPRHSVRGFHRAWKSASAYSVVRIRCSEGHGPTSIVTCPANIE